MARFLYTQYNFSNGELSPRLLGRTDLREYYNSCKFINNYVVSKEGSLNEVSGVRNLYTYGVGDGVAEFVIDRKRRISDSPRFIVGFKAPFFPTESNYDNVLDIYQASEEIASDVGFVQSVSLLEVSNFIPGDKVTINDTTIITDKNGTNEPIVIYPETLHGTGQWKVSNYTHWARALNTNAWAAEAGFRSIPLTPIDQDPAVIATVSGTSVTINTAGYVVEDMVNSYLELIDGSNSYIGQIVAHSVNTVTVIWVGSAAPNGNYDFFRLPEWYQNNWPKVVSLIDQRLVFANSNAKSQGLWFSRTGSLGDFTVKDNETFATEEPFALPISTIDTSAIYWAISERHLTIGTATEEFIITRVDGQFGLGSVNVQSVSKYGSAAPHLAVRSQSSTFFVERDGKTIRQMSFSEENGGYVSKNIGILGPEIGLVSKIIYDYSNKRFYVTADNGLFTCTIEASSGVLGWSRVQETGRVLGTLQGDVIFEDGSSFGILDIHTEAELITMDLQDNTGASKLTDIEISAVKGRKHIRTSQDIEFGPAPTFTPTYISSFTNLGFTIGQTVNILLEDLTVEEYTLVDHLGNPSAKNAKNILAIIEDPKTSRMETTPIQQGASIGDSQLAFQRADKVAVRLHEARGVISIGTADSNKETMTYETPFAGVHETHVDGSPEIDHTIIIENDTRYPVSISNILVRGTGQEG